MIIYHTVWDLVSIGVLPRSFLISAPAVVWQRSICFTFIILSGFCFSLSKNPFKSGAVVFAAGLLVTAAAFIIMPKNRIIFGILTFLGSAVILTALINYALKRLRPAVGMVLCAVLFALSFNISKGYFAGFPLPASLYKNYITAFLGFPFRGFASADYFPFFPWYFLYLFGYFSFSEMKSRNMMRFLKTPEIPVLNFIGRHALAIYLIHQPVIYAAVYAAAGVIRTYAALGINSELCVNFCCIIYKLML